jgi:hypothetical protein
MTSQPRRLSCAGEQRGCYRQVSARGMVDHCAHARRAGETPAVSHQQLDLSEWLQP